MRQAEGDLSHVISGWLADSGGTREKWIEDTSPASFAPAGCANVSLCIGVPEATDLGRLCGRHWVHTHICPVAAQSCRGGFCSTGSASPSVWTGGRRGVGARLEDAQPDLCQTPHPLPARYSRNPGRGRACATEPRNTAASCSR
jgi:hypothetical protein